MEGTTYQDPLEWPPSKSDPAFQVIDAPLSVEIEHVLRTVRREDRVELEAWARQSEEVLTGLLALDHVWVALQHGVPVFVWGLKEHTPGSFFLVGLGSEQLEKCTLRALTRYGMKTWLPFVFYCLNVRRIEALVPIQSVHSINWLTKLGMIPEGVSKDYVQRGDRFVRLAYTISDFEGVDDVLVFDSQGTSRSSHSHEVGHGHPA